MKKSEIHEIVVLASATILEAVAGTKLEELVRTELNKIDEVTKPGVGGAKVDPESVCVRNEDGEVTHIQCSLSKRWLPVYDEEGNENFYSDTKNDTFGGFKRLSKKAESIRQKSAKAIKATEAAVLADLLNKDVELSEEDAQKLIADSKVIDYTVVGSETRPA